MLNEAHLLHALRTRGSDLLSHPVANSTVEDVEGVGTLLLQAAQEIERMRSDQYWKEKASAWLRAKADAQEKTNRDYPEHTKAYPSWEKRVRDLRWDAEELEGKFGSYGAPAAGPNA
jgi:hypothetical protein